MTLHLIHEKENRALPFLDVLLTRDQETNTFRLTPNLPILQHTYILNPITLLMSRQVLFASREHIALAYRKQRVAMTVSTMVMGMIQ